MAKIDTIWLVTGLERNLTLNRARVSSLGTVFFVEGCLRRDARIALGIVEHTMNILWLLLVLAVGAYLLYALLKPERF
jgi:K+-transporting ATPase KdpF subunit